MVWRGRGGLEEGSRDADELEEPPPLTSCVFNNLDVIYRVFMRYSRCRKASIRISVACVENKWENTFYFLCIEKKKGCIFFFFSASKGAKTVFVFVFFTVSNRKKNISCFFFCAVHP